MAMRTALVRALVAAAALAQPQYPEGAPVPRSLTEEERLWLRDHPLGATDGVTPPPTGPVRCVAEYEPMAGLLMAWEGTTSWNAILTQMAVQATNFASADVWMVCDSASEQALVQSTLGAAGVNLSRVRFVVTPTDTIWIRDYGPRFIYQGECRAVVDHTYNRPRPNDDVLPAFFASQRRHPFYEHQLVHGGGNFHLDALGRSYVTRLVNNENPGLGELQIRDIWRSYQNVDTTFFDPFPTGVDFTQHIDMWVQVLADDKVLVSDWPANPGSIQDVICDGAAIVFAQRGYTVFRVPARSIGGTHYTFTNAVLLNGTAMIPSYTNATVVPHNAEAQAVWAAALPGWRIVPIASEAIVSAAGVLHCIVMHVPAPRGGTSPTAWLSAPQGGGPALAPNTPYEIRWITDDDEAVVNVDLLLSTDDGATFPTTIAAGTADDGSHTWTVPDLRTSQARVRVVARDAGGRTGGDASDLAFAIAGAGCPAGTASYGSGKPGLRGVPVLTSPAPPVLGGAWTLALSNALPSWPAVLVVGLQPASFPFDGGTLLALPSGLIPITTGPGGDWTMVLALPDQPALCGVNVFFQVGVPNDPGAAGAGWALTAGLRATAGR
jgi:agmatine/peptidylarginine deiminase